jgi:hypothetical protein
MAMSNMLGGRSDIDLDCWTIIPNLSALTDEIKLGAWIPFRLNLKSYARKKTFIIQAQNI